MYFSIIPRNLPNHSCIFAIQAGLVSNTGVTRGIGTNELVAELVAGGTILTGSFDFNGVLVGIVNCGSSRGLKPGNDPGTRKASISIRLNFVSLYTDRLKIMIAYNQYSI